MSSIGFYGKRARPKFDITKFLEDQAAMGIHYPGKVAKDSPGKRGCEMTCEYECISDICFGKEHCPQYKEISEIISGLEKEVERLASLLILLTDFSVIRHYLANNHPVIFADIRNLLTPNLSKSEREDE